MQPPRSIPTAPWRSIAEVVVDGPVPGLVHPEWRERWPGLAQGLTRPGPDRVWDFRLFSGAGLEAVERWQLLGPATGCDAVVHAHQPHGAAVRTHGPLPPGLHLCTPVDGHTTDRTGLLLAVTVADCVPAFLVAPQPGAVSLVHAGWRGAAAGILERAIATMGDRHGVSPGELALHLGPSICGGCYEVGPEVHEGLGEDVPTAPAPVDLRRDLAHRAAARGVPVAEITISALCTRCGEVDLFSHRGGDPGRQVAFLGRR